MLYETRSYCLRYLMDCGIFKTPWNICSAFKHFWSQSLNSAVYSTLAVTMRRQCLLPHVELISIDAINSVWTKSLLFSPALGWSEWRGWMSSKAINHKQRGVSLYSPLKTFWKPPLSTHCITKLRPWQTWGWRQPPGYNPAPHVPPPPPYPEGDGDLRARVPVMEMTKLSTHNKAHWAEGPGCSGSCSISGAMLSPSELCWIIALQPCKITRTSAHGKEKKEKYEQEH